jgi:hypothetical protein
MGFGTVFAMRASRLFLWLGLSAHIDDGLL